MRRKWKRLALPLAMILLLSGCLFRSPDDLYRKPVRSAGYEQLMSTIRGIRSGLEAEFGVTSEDALIVSGDKTATIQLQDMDGDGQRETAITFIRVPDVEKPMKVFLFRKIEGVYQLTGKVEGTGSAIYSVDYAELNGKGQKELVINWQVSAGVYQLGAYTLDDLAPAVAEEPKLLTVSADQKHLLATELLLTGCSTASESGSYSSGYRVLDIDQDARMEIAVVHMDSAGGGGYVEVYGWQDGSFSSLSLVNLSAGAISLNQIRSNYLSGEYYPPALYITTSLADGSRAVDVVAYGEEGLVNMSRDPETGVSRNLLRSSTDIGLGPVDVNSDYILELPSSARLPLSGGLSNAEFWLTQWSHYLESGEEEKVVTTYHNTDDSWYLEIPEEWVNQITISRNDSRSGQRQVLFSLWRGEEETPVPFLSIYKLTGSNRTARAAEPGRFILREEGEVIYAARFAENGWDCGLDQMALLERFHTIQPSWYTG